MIDDSVRRETIKDDVLHHHRVELERPEHLARLKSLFYIAMASRMHDLGRRKIGLSPLAQ